MPAPTLNDYRATVQAAAQAIVDGLADDSISDEYDAIHEEVDGSCYVIYYHMARKVVDSFSDNGEIGIDEMGWEAITSGTSGLNDVYTRLAYYAMTADVAEQVSKIQNNDWKKFVGG